MKLTSVDIDLTDENCEGVMNPMEFVALAAEHGVHANYDAEYRLAYLFDLVAPPAVLYAFLIKIGFGDEGASDLFDDYSYGLGDDENDPAVIEFEAYLNGRSS